ncbi:MAG TPA: transporter substrate-binding domain-containing protein, partial [Bryobacteraceae bacterium]
MLTTRKQLWIAAASSLAVVAPLSVYLFHKANHIDRPLRIGYQNSPPYHFPDVHGNPTGPAVDIIRAAAARQGIELKWVFSPQGPEKALDSGAVDLWPILGELPERRRLAYVSPPWTEMSFMIVAPESRSIRSLEDMAGKTLAASVNISLEGRIAREYLGHAVIVPSAGTTDVLDKVCSGAAAAGLISVNRLSGLRIGSCAAGALHIVPIRGATFWFGVGANRRSPVAISAANLLRDEIGQMA